MSSPTTAVGSTRGPVRDGLALPTILFAIVVIGIIGAMVFVMTDLHAKSTSNRERAIRAMHLAETGMSHALALVRDSTLRDTTLTRLLRGSDGAKNTADDGLLTGYGLPSTIDIPASGRSAPGGTYYVRLIDDPAEVDNDVFTDRNTRILAICRGVATDGSTATINAILGNQSLPGYAVNGNVEISGTTRVTGRCGGVHANGTLKVNTPLTVQTGASSSGTTTGTITNTYGENLPKQQNAEPISFPDITASMYCGQADYHIRSNGTVLNLLTGAVLTPASLGWSGGTSTWEVMSNVAPGTYCVDGNVKMSNDFGTAANPRMLSLIVKGSMEVSGNPYMTADTPGLMWIMDGDLKLNGNSTSTTPNYNGFIYAGSQCEMSGTVAISGQVACANKPNPPYAENWVAENKISGTTNITFGCGGFLGEFWRIISWYPSFQP